MGGLIDMERKGYESIGCYTCFVSSCFDLDPGFSSWCGLGTFLSWWPPSTMWVGPSIFYGHHRGCLNNPIFSNLGVMCCILRTFHVSSQIVANMWVTPSLFSITFYPSALRAGRVLSSRSGRAGGCQTCGTHISVTVWWIFSIRSSVELSRCALSRSYAHLPHMGLPMGQKLVKFATNWVQT